MSEDKSLMSKSLIISFSIMLVSLAIGFFTIFITSPIATVIGTIFGGIWFISVPITLILGFLNYPNVESKIFSILSISVTSFFMIVGILVMALALMVVIFEDIADGPIAESLVTDSDCLLECEGVNSEYYIIDPNTNSCVCLDASGVIIEGT